MVSSMIQWQNQKILLLVFPRAYLVTLSHSEACTQSYTVTLKVGNITYLNHQGLITNLQAPSS